MVARKEVGASHFYFSATRLVTSCGSGNDKDVQVPDGQIRKAMLW